MSTDLEFGIQSSDVRPTFSSTVSLRCADGRNSVFNSQDSIIKAVFAP